MLDYGRGNAADAPALSYARQPESDTTLLYLAPSVGHAHISPLFYYLLALHPGVLWSTQFGVFHILPKSLKYI